MFLTKAAYWAYHQIRFWKGFRTITVQTNNDVWIHLCDGMSLPWLNNCTMGLPLSWKHSSERQNINEICSMSSKRANEDVCLCDPISLEKNINNISNWEILEIQYFAIQHYLILFLLQTSKKKKLNKHN